jgi:single-strand DNA-binding protein
MQNGNRVANLSMATSERWFDKQANERREKTEWHRVVIFDEKLIDVVEQYVHKGSKIYLEGQLQTRKWPDQSGVEKYSTEVVLQRFRGVLTMLDSKGDSGGVSGGDMNGDTGGDTDGDTGGGDQSSGAGPSPDLNDDIPF